MIRPVDQESSEADPSPLPSDHDERVGEAIESFLTLIEQGEVPDPEEFAARFPDLEQDVLAALHGLELMNGLVGHLPGGSSTGSSNRQAGPGRSLESGRRIAGYRIVRELGRGGMGTVYEAVHIALDRPVALKILGSHAAPDSSARRRFLNEARTAARLHHTNIVPVFDVGQVGGLCYYAMQRIEGTGLDRVVRAQRKNQPPAGEARASQASSRVEKTRDPAATTPSNPSSSSHSSKLGKLWVRVSAGWLKRSISDGIDDSNLAKSYKSNGAKVARRLERHEAHELDDSGFNGAIGSWNGSAPSELGSRQSERDLRSSLFGLSQAEEERAKDFLPGTAVDDRAGEPPFTPPKGSSFYRWVAEIGLQAAEALAHAHHQGVIHRDVKPSNLLIDAKGTVWVTDFGLARRLADPGLTQHDSLLGTPRYMSPEQARPGTIDGRTDVFSLGGTLYELLTRRPAFDGKSAAELVEQIAKVDPPSLRSIDPRIPRDLETIVLKMLAKRPADRYSSASSLAEDLARFLNHEPVKARRISPVGRLWRVARRHPGMTGVSTVAAASILAIATYAHVRVVNALDKSEKANQRNVSLLRTSHWQNAVLLRLSPGMLGRRAQSFDLVKKAAELDPDPKLKQKLRDEAVESLFIRDVEKSEELETGRVRGLLFESADNRLAALTETDEGEQLVFWDINQRRHGESIPLGLSPRQSVVVADSPNNSPPAVLPKVGATSEPTANDERVENSGARRSPSTSRGAASPNPGGAGRPGNGGSQGGLGRFRFGRMTSVGGAIAVILPSDRLSRVAEAFARHQMVDIIGLALTGQAFERISLLDRLALSSRNFPMFPTRDRGLCLIDAITGDKIREVHSPLGSLVGVYGATNGRFVTVDLEPPAGRPLDFQRRFQVNLWSLESPEKPLARLELPRVEAQLPSPGASPSIGFSPDGEKVAIGWGNLVVVHSTKDGATLSKFDAQTPLTALAIGPNDLMATAGGGNVRFWDLGSETTFVSSLTPTQNVVVLMKFSPDGAVLALVGRDEPTIELVDPLSRSQISLLRSSDRVSDLAFAPDGRSLAAGGQGLTTTVWKILGSAARVQLSGFDESVSSLAFRKDGFLAIGTVDGEIWGSKTKSLVGTSCTPLVPNSGQTTVSPVSTEFAASRPSSPAAPPNLSLVGSTSRTQTPPPDRNAGPEREQRIPRDRPQSLVLAYDDLDRLVVVHDSDSPRMSTIQAVGQAPEPLMISVPLPRTNAPQRGFQFASLSRTADGRAMLISRASRFFLWRSDSPETLIPVIPPGSERDAGFRPEISNPSSKSQATGKSVAPGFSPMQPPGRGPRGGGGNRFPGGSRFGAARMAPGGHRIYLIDFETGTPLAWDLVAEADHIQAKPIEWPSAPREIVGMTLSADGAVLALGRRDGQVLLVETGSMQTKGSIAPVDSEAIGPIQTMAFSPDGRCLAVATQHGPVILWKLKRSAKSDSVEYSWETRFHLRLPVYRGPIRLLAFDPSGVRLAGTGTEPLVEVWNVNEIQGELARLRLDD